jgi:fumarylacetoacetase
MLIPLRKISHSSLFINHYTMLSPNDPALKTWVDVPADSDFPIQNLPFGIFKPHQGHARAGVAIGNMYWTCRCWHSLGYFDIYG